MPDGADESLVLATQRAAHHLADVLHSTAGRLGLTQAEIHILAYLARSGGGSTAAIGRSFGHRRSTLTSILDRLSARGLVRRQVDPHDRRSFRIELTTAGAGVADQAAQAVRAIDHHIGERVSPAQVAGFWAVVAAIAEQTNPTSKATTEQRT